MTKGKARAAIEKLGYRVTANLGDGITIRYSATNSYGNHKSATTLNGLYKKIYKY